MICCSMLIVAYVCNAYFQFPFGIFLVIISDSVLRVLLWLLPSFLQVPSSSFLQYALLLPEGFSESK